MTRRTIQAVERDRGREPKYDVGNAGGGGQRRDPLGGCCCDGHAAAAIVAVAIAGVTIACSAPLHAMMVRRGRGNHVRDARVRLIVLRAGRHRCIALQRQQQREQHGKPETQRSIQSHTPENIPPIDQYYTRTAHTLG
jgi:hypothetical protein